MTPDQFRAALASLRLSQRGFADLAHVDERQARRWAAGATIPAPVAEWLERASVTIGPLHDQCEAWLRDNPLPVRNNG